MKFLRTGAETRSEFPTTDGVYSLSLHHLIAGYPHRHLIEADYPKVCSVRLRTEIDSALCCRLKCAPIDMVYFINRLIFTPMGHMMAGHDRESSSRETPPLPLRLSEILAASTMMPDCLYLPSRHRRDNRSFVRRHDSEPSATKPGLLGRTVKRAFIAIGEDSGRKPPREK
jgi:hypothetical protein